MPYCPKCDMEFIEGISVCSDCGGPLAASKEEAADQAAASLPEENWNEEYRNEEGRCEEALQEDEAGSSGKKRNPLFAPANLYRKKSQQYEDLKSSASAFYLVGGILLIASVLCWSGVIRLPFSGPSGWISQSVITLLAVVSLVTAVVSTRSASVIKTQVEEEDAATHRLVSWFLDSYPKETLEQRLAVEFEGLTEEERGLKRIELIQDLLITSHDITDQAYADMLSEELYEKLYEE